MDRTEGSYKIDQLLTGGSEAKEFPIGHPAAW